MKTCVEILSIEDLTRILTYKHYLFTSVTVRPYGINNYDPRNGWHTHIVSIDNKAIGFTSGMPKPASFNLKGSLKRLWGMLKW
jgi:hypothetical protein